MSEPTCQAQGSPLERMVGLPASDRECLECHGSGGATRRVDAPHVGYYRVECPRCGGSGRVQADNGASPKEKTL